MVWWCLVDTVTRTDTLIPEATTKSSDVIMSMAFLTLTEQHYTK